LWDLFWALTSPALALYLRDTDIALRADWSGMIYYWLLSSGFALTAFFALRIQDGMTRHFSVHEALDIAEAVLLAGLMTCAAMFTMTRLDGIPRSMPLIHGLLLAGGLIAARMAVRIVFSEADAAQDYHARRERIVLIGANRFAASFIHLLRAYAPQREPVIAVLDHNAAMVGRAIAGVQVLGAPDELDAIITEFAVHGVDTDRVVIAGESDFLSPAALREIERICQKRQIDLSFLPRMIGVTEWKAPEQAGKVVARPQPGEPVPAYFRFKRLIDVVASLGLIVLLSPLFLLAAFLVLLNVGTPILFWQERLGWKGRSFLIYKFRTLGAPFDSDGAPTFSGRQPSAIGRMLRATRLDEFPQLLNVLLGDMSLIGPRPLLPEDQPSNVSLRLSVRPGISGWAQINGAKLVSREEKEKLDEWYVRHASFLLDLRIAFATLRLMLGSRLSSREAVADVAQVQGKDFGMSLDPSDVRRRETVA
jgi:lipopolysaccharide/colanic/teichoic acid biosynthesis glycosyltransferase